MTLPPMLAPLLDPIPPEACLEQFRAMEFFMSERACAWPRVPYARRRTHGFDVTHVDQWITGAGLSDDELARRDETMPAFSVIAEHMPLFYTPDGVLHALGRLLMEAAVPMYANGVNDYPAPTEPLAIAFRRYVFEIRVPIPGRHAFAPVPPDSVQ